MKQYTFLTVLLAALLASLPASGLDWGGVLDNETTLSQADETDFTQKDKLSLWVESEIGDRLSILAQGSYTYADDRPYLFDIDTLVFGGKYPNAGKNLSMFSFSLGRFTISEFSKYILDHSADGFALNFIYPSTTVSFALGYTGLHLKPVSEIKMSKADSKDSRDDEVYLAPPRMVGAIKVAFPEAFSRQDLTLSLAFQQDLRDPDDVLEEGDTVPDYSTGGLLNTQYLGAGLSGPLSSTLYYDAFFYFGTGKVLSYIDGEYEYSFMLSGLGGFGLRYYMESFLSSRAEVRFLYASGDEDADTSIEGNTKGLATQFTPISKPTLGLVFEPLLSNLFLLELSYSLKPLAATGSGLKDSLQTVIKNINFFRATKGPITEGGIDPDSDALYLGSEIDGIVNFRPFSDLGAAFSLGLFIPNSGTGGAFLDDQRALEVLGKLEFSLSF